MNRFQVFTREKQQLLLDVSSRHNLSYSGYLHVGAVWSGTFQIFVFWVVWCWKKWRLTNLCESLSASSVLNGVVEGSFLPILLLELPKKKKKSNAFLVRNYGNYEACRRVKLCNLKSSCLFSSILYGISTWKHYVHQADIIQEPVMACSNLKPRYILVQEEYCYSTRNTFGEWNARMR